MGMGVGANTKPTMVELIRTMAIGRRRKKSKKKTMMTYHSPPIPSAPEPGGGRRAFAPREPPDQHGNRMHHHQRTADGYRVREDGQRHAERDRVHDVEVARRLPAEPN